MHLHFSKKKKVKYGHVFSPKIKFQKLNFKNASNKPRGEQEGEKY